MQVKESHGIVVSWFREGRRSSLLEAQCSRKSLMALLSRGLLAHWRVRVAGHSMPEGSYIVSSFPEAAG